MFGSKITDTITFSYNKKELFDDVSLLSAYMVKNVVTDAGSAMDSFAITDDEEEVYNKCIEQTLPNIYETLVKLSSGVDDAFNSSVVVSPDDTDELERKSGTYIELTIRDNGAYNYNVLGLVDDTIRDCLKYGVLAEYYSVNANASLFQLAQDKFASNMLLLNQRLFQLKRKSVTSLLQ